MQLVKGAIYYPICLDFKFHQLYIIWISDDVDEVLVNDDNKIVGFKKESELKAHLKKHNCDLCDELANYEIYKLQQWLIRPIERFDYDVFLNLWNLFTDVSASIGLVFIGDLKEKVRDGIYEKLFNASDVFIANDPNPTFEITEIAVLIEVMENGLGLLLNNLVIVEN